MSIIAFNFTKIAGEKKPGTTGKTEVNHSTKIISITEVPVGKQPALKFDCSHVITYMPGESKLEIHSEIIVLLEAAKVKSIISDFSKKKTFDPVIMEAIYNTVLGRSNVEALILSKDLNLPAPMRLPRLDINRAMEAKKDAAPVSKASGKKSK